ncbi:Clp protease N-terminal domain-containing protein [Streptomyces sp. NPDC087300]|uniref:Clp protease N-terminal domain-containing protein n=1 Tax=Streptomyces sp. NPDC087300 TaxID=3365780 RepID=UPI00380DDF65
MEAIKSPDWNVVGILGAARGARPDAGAATGTEHLLAGLTTAKGPARGALAAQGVTRTVLLTVLRDRAHGDDAWSADDDSATTVVSKDVLGEDGDGRSHFTGAAARALTSAMTHARREGAKKFGAEHLLRGLLEEDNRAVELLAACGLTPQAVGEGLDGGPEGDPTSGPGGEEDSLGPLLHATRDMLLGRDHYRRMPLWTRWTVRFSGINWASLPSSWVRLETYEQARRLGDDVVGTEHVLLAVLATHEVARTYPHLARESAPGHEARYSGGERLARLGIDHASVYGALTAGAGARLTADARSVEEYVGEEPGPNLESSTDPGTGPLVETLLSEETRARQLIEALTGTGGA